MWGEEIRRLVAVSARQAVHDRADESTHTRHIFEGQFPRRLDAQEGRQFLDEGAESVRRRLDRAQFRQLGLDEGVRDEVDRHGDQGVGRR